MAGWIKMPIGGEVDFGPNDIVLNEDPAPQKMDTAAATFTPMSHDMLLYGRFLTFFCLLWPPYEIGQAIIFLPCGFYLLLLFSSPNLSGLRLDVYHTSTHGVALA